MTDSQNADPAGPAEPSEGVAAEGSSARSPVWVLSLAVFRDASRREILLGVRRSLPTARRHPGVLSTPTMRIPAELFHLLVAGADPRDLPPGTVALLDGHPGHSVGEHAYAAAAAHAVEALLVRKLALAEALLAARFQATARLRAIALKNVADPQGTATAEWTAMATYEVVVDRGADAFPESSPAYSRLIWAPAELVGRAFAAHDALLLDDSLDPFEVCIDGLCVQSAIPVIPPAR